MKPLSNIHPLGRPWYNAFLQTWQQFWHPEGSTLGLGLFRIVFAYCLFMEVSVTRSKSLFAIEGNFHLPYPYVPSFIQPLPEQIYHLLHLLQYPLIILLGLGLVMRPAIVGLLMLQGYIFFSDAQNFRNHPYFFLLVLLLLLCSSADESVSFKSARRMYESRSLSIDAVIGPRRSLTFQRLIMVQVSIVYFFAGLQKMNLGFLGGSVLARELDRIRPLWGGQLAALFGQELSLHIQQVLQNGDVLIVASMLSLGLELLLPFTLWFRATRVPSIIVGTIFHITIAFFMNIDQFSDAMIGSYLLFLKPDTLPTLLRRLLSPAISRRTVLTFRK